MGFVRSIEGGRVRNNFGPSHITGFSVFERIGEKAELAWNLIYGR